MLLEVKTIFSSDLTGGSSLILIYLFFFPPNCSTLNILALILSILWLCSDISEHVFHCTICLCCILSFHLEVKLFSSLVVVTIKSAWSLAQVVSKDERSRGHGCAKWSLCTAAVRGHKSLRQCRCCRTVTVSSWSGVHTGSWTSNITDVGVTIIKLLSLVCCFIFFPVC